MTILENKKLYGNPEIKNTCWISFLEHLKLQNLKFIFQGSQKNPVRVVISQKGWENDFKNWNNFMEH